MSDYLFHLRTLLGSRYSEDSFLHTDLLPYKLLNSLNAYTRLNLYHYKEAPLGELAHHADNWLRFAIN